MSYRKLDVGKNFLVRAEHDSDLIKFITELTKKNGIVIATFTAIGALKRAKLGFYDQTKHEYSETLLSTPQEIASCVGNVSIKDNEPFVHAHAVLADQNGNTNAGHLLEGKVFAAEIHLTELIGRKLERKHDSVTGLSLWEI
jgi:predicted DNA-binding protein with PD1-like motif